jgi:antitoxin component of MazEF toxin-antitoxin module
MMGDMARRKLDRTKCSQTYKDRGNSISLTLPIDIVRELKWRQGQKVVVAKKGGSVIIKDWKK